MLRRALNVLRNFAFNSANREAMASGSLLLRLVWALAHPDVSPRAKTTAGDILASLAQVYDLAAAMEAASVPGFLALLEAMLAARDQAQIENALAILSGLALNPANDRWCLDFFILLLLSQPLVHFPP